MTLSDIIQRARDLLTEQDNTGRFSDAELTRYVNVSQRRVSMEVRFPEVRITGNTASGTQEYALPEDVLAIKRLYVGGQPIPRTDIDTMEGNQILLYDQTTTTYSPQWQSVASAAYPVSSDQGFPAPIALPYYPGVRPMFYERGGVFGLVPAPAGVYPMILDGIALAPDLVNLGDVAIFPRSFLDALAWGAIQDGLFGDRDEQGYQWAEARRREAMALLRDTLDSRSGPRSIRPLTYRSIFDVEGYGGYSNGWGW